MTVRPGSPEVTVTGPRGELLLFVAGRQDVVRVEPAGDADAAGQVRQAKLGL